MCVNVYCSLFLQRHGRLFFLSCPVLFAKGALTEGSMQFPAKLCRRKIYSWKQIVGLMERVRQPATQEVTTGKRKESLCNASGRQNPPFIYRNFSEMEKNNHYPPRTHLQWRHFINHYHKAGLNHFLLFFVYVRRNSSPLYFQSTRK